MDAFREQLSRVLPPSWLASPVAGAAAGATASATAGAALGVATEPSPAGATIEPPPADAAAEPPPKRFKRPDLPSGSNRTPAWLAEGSHGDGALPPSALPPTLQAETRVAYAGLKLVDRARRMLLTPTQYAAGVSLAQLHTLPADDRSPEATPLPLWYARIQAGVVKTCTKQQKKEMLRSWAKHPDRLAFDAVYLEFVRTVMAPHLAQGMGDGRTDIVYQQTYAFRVVFPQVGSRVTPCMPHRDADYRHLPEELNFWCPLTPVFESNSLYVESAPGLADWHPFTLPAPEPGGEGSCVAWFGNQCRHFTLPNDTDQTRVSFDSRAVPPALWRDRGGEVAGPDGKALRLDGAGAYYKRLQPP